MIYRHFIQTTLLAYVLVVLGVLTLSPFRFAWPTQWIVLWWGDFDDLPNNILLFVPLGFIFGLLRERASPRAALLSALLFGALASLAIETAQLFLQARSSSLLDGVGNALGCVLGALMCAALRAQMERRMPGALTLDLPLINLLYLLLPLMWLAGTGIGAGILIDNRVLHGHSDIVGAIGWLALKPPYTHEYDECGCFETHCSGEGLAKQARKFLREDKEYRGELRKHSIEDITSYHIFEAYDNGDTIAKRVMEEAIEMWGMATANLISIFNPEKVIFGGGVFGPAVKFIPQIRREAEKCSTPVQVQSSRRKSFIARVSRNEATRPSSKACKTAGE